MNATRGSIRVPFRVGGQYAADVLAWVAAFVAAQFLRFDFELTPIPVWWTLGFVVLLATLQMAVGWFAQLYRARHLRGSFAEIRSLVVTVVAVATPVTLVIIVLGPELGIPRSTGIIAAPIALVGMAAVRYLRRLRAERPLEPAEGAERALVYGAGDLGALMIRRMRRDPDSPFLPAGLLDDAPEKRNIRLHGVPVLGDGDDMAAVANRVGATVVIVTISRANAELLRRIADSASAAGLAMKVLPPLDEVREGRTRVRDLRDVEIEDIIGRHPVDTAVEAVADYLSGRRVLVTGAGGSIGSELCRQVAKFSPAELIMLDRDETSLQALQLSLDGRGLLDTDALALADIRDAEAIAEIFRSRRPEVVFHAAALKHLSLLERFPEEAWKTNVLGTRNVLEAARSVGVETFINISTDKAANPANVLGHSKRLAEGLTAWYAEQTGWEYVSVRFGNVLGSRGSVIPTFASLIEAGQPITVTDPEATRYFMTIPEACQLVVQAGAIGKGGEVLVLDMGQPVRILDVATRMIDMSGRDLPIVFTGLRPGEKLHEELFGESEADRRREHPRISHTVAPPLPPADLSAHVATFTR